MLSSHDFTGVPDDLTGRAQAMRATGAEVVKIAVQTSRLTDCLPLLDLGAQIARQGTVLIGMGECGLATRVLARKFGSLAGLIKIAPDFDEIPPGFEEYQG